MERSEALRRMDEVDHCFVSEEFATEVAQAFNVKQSPPCYVGHSDPPATPKGLTMKCEGDRGMPVEDLATWLCVALDIKYPLKFGRGSQLRVCLRALDIAPNKKGR